MTLAAGLFGDLAASVGDLDRLFEPPGSEVVGVPETVASLCGILAEEAGGRMAVVADCNRPVGGFDPPIKLIAHDVTVCAGGRVVGHVRPALCIGEGEDSYADCYAERYAKRNASRRAQSHSDSS